MKTVKELKETGYRWSTKSKCELYVVKGNNEWLWYMFSPKTGTHLVKNKGLYGQPYADERVVSHWKGFIKNQ